MKGKEFNVSATMAPHLIFVLERDKVRYKYHLNEDGSFIFLAELSGKQFHIMMEDALCERQRSKTWSRIPIYSNRTLRNSEKRKRLMRLNNSNAFGVLKKDKKKWYQDYGLELPEKDSKDR